MKKMRKALSFVLILALVMGSISMAFGAGTTNDGPAKLSDVAGLLGEDQITVCQNLGIIEGMPDGTFQPAQLVNRAQFAAIITRALGIPESALAGYSTTSFQDTSGYGWAVPYLAFCQSKGIMIGDGYGNAMPGRTITVNEAMTMILRAIGYVDNSAELVGKWPANFVTKAKSVGLYDDVADEVYMDRENAAIAIYNALTVALVSVATDGKTETILTKDTYTTETGETAFWPLYLITAGLNCYPLYSVVSEADFGNALINIADLLGGWGIKFIDRKSEEIVAFKMESVFLTGWVDGKKFYVEDEDKSYALEADAMKTYYVQEKDPADMDETISVMHSDVHMFLNGEFIPWGYSEDDDYFTPEANWRAPWDLIDEFVYWGYEDDDEIDRLDGAAAWASDGEEVTLAVKLAGLTVKRIYSVASWRADVMTVISANELTALDDSELLGIDFPLNDDQKIDIKQFQLIGVESLDDIEANDVVYVYADQLAGKDSVIRRVAVGQETIEGTIDESNGDFIIVDDEEYWYASEYLFHHLVGLNGGDLTDGVHELIESAGDDAIIRLDAYGYAYNVDITGEAGLFGIVVSDEPHEVPGGVQAMVLTADDVEKVLQTVRLSKVDYYEPRDEYGTKRVKADDPYDGAFEQASLIGYKLNKDGLITAVEDAAEGDITVRSKTVLDFEGKRFLIDSSCVVFGENEDGDDWFVSSVAEIDLTKFIDDDSKAPIAHGGAMILDTKGHKVVALFLPEEALNPDTATVYGVINGYTNVNKDQNITGIFDGSAKTLRTIDRSDLEIDEASDYFTEDNLYELGFWQLKENSSGRITKAKNLLSEDWGWESEETEMRLSLPIDEPWGVIERTGGNQIKVSSDGTRSADDEAIDFIPMESNVIVYKAEYSGGKFKYSKSNPANIPGVNSNGECRAIAFGFDTKKEKDITKVANVVIWVPVEDLYKAGYIDGEYDEDLKKVVYDWGWL